MHLLHSSRQRGRTDETSKTRTSTRGRQPRRKGDPATASAGRSARRESSLVQGEDFRHRPSQAPTKDMPPPRLAMLVSCFTRWVETSRAGKRWSLKASDLLALATSYRARKADRVGRDSRFGDGRGPRSDTPLVHREGLRATKKYHQRLTCKLGVHTSSGSHPRSSRRTAGAPLQDALGHNSL